MSLSEETTYNVLRLSSCFYFQNYDQKAGRIIFLSGATGRPLGKYMELPQEKETFLSPQAYRTADGSLYFFLGSGGETTAGEKSCSIAVQIIRLLRL